MLKRLLYLLLLFCWPAGLWQPEEGLPKHAITAFAEDQSGGRWFSTYGEGLYVWKNQRLYQFNVADDGLLGDEIYALRQPEGAQVTYLRRMLMRFNNSIKLVDMQDAAYFYTKDKITFLVVRSTGKRFPVDYPLDKLEELLDPVAFFRINRQFIINVAVIREMHTYSKSRVKVSLEPPTDMDTIVSTERSAAFKKWLIGEQV